MHVVRSLFVLALTASIALAGPAVSNEEMAPAELTRWLTFFDQLVNTVVRDQGSCDKMATDVAAVIDANQRGIAAARAARAAHKKLPEGAQQHMLDGVRRMSPGIERCGENERVKAAFAKLEVNPPK